LSQTEDKTSLELLDRLVSDENKSWCPVPWISLSTTTDGHYRLCGRANTCRKTRGLYTDDSGRYLMADNDSAEDARNSRLAKEVRTYMLKGVQHPTCQRCLSEEQSGLLSARARMRSDYSISRDVISVGKCQESTRSDGSIDCSDFPLIELELRLGNKCNLSCRSCHPGESSGWYKEWVSQGKTSFKIADRKYHFSGDRLDKSSARSLEWYSDSRLLKTFSLDYREIEYISIAGGEPLLISEHYDLLEDIINSGRAPFITLSYNSNVTVVPPAITQLWPHFRKIKLGYSIDGIGKVNDYIRWPSRFDSIAANISKISKISENIEMWPTVTLMAYNVLYIPEIIAWVVEQDFHRSQHPMNMFAVLHSLKNPPELSLKVMTPQARKVILHKMEDFRQNWFKSILVKQPEDLAQQMIGRLEYIFGYIESELKVIYDGDLHALFLQRTEEMDRFRGQNMSNYLPELHELMWQKMR
jgi:MoaA/NifB/PqqE/SkfB family radical SAM enzyme